MTICQFARDNSHDDVGQRLSCCHGGYLVRARSCRFLQCTTFFSCLSRMVSVKIITFEQAALKTPVKSALDDMF